MSSSIIVDGTVSDAIVEYGIILDSIQRTNENSQLLQSLQDNEDNKTLISFLNNSLDIIFKLNEKDFESVFNLYLYLLVQLSEDLNAALVESKITDKCLQVDNDSLIYVSILTNIFNSLPEDSIIRFELLSTIIKIVDNKNKLKLILDFEFDIYYKWLSPIKSDSEIIKFLTHIIEILESQYPEQSLKIYENLIVNLNDSIVEEDVNNFLVQSFNNEFKLDLSSYSKLKLDKASPDFKELLIFYNAKDLSSFETFYRSNSKTFAKINYDTLKLKLNITKLVTSSYGLNKLSYQDLFQILQMDDNNIENLENLIIYSIKKNFINGKLNQFKQTLEINHVKYLGDFNLDNWKNVQSKLNNWKTSLREIKENIDNNKKAAITKN